MDIQKILEELGLDTLPEKEQQKILEAMTISLTKRINVEILERLSDEDKEEFDNVRERGDVEEFNSFLRSKIDGYDEMLERVVEEFKKEMKANMEMLSKEN